MPKITAVADDVIAPADVVIVGVRPGPELDAAAGPIDAVLGQRLRDALRAVGATGKQDDVARLATFGLAPFPLVVATGLGTEQNPESVRRAVGAAVRTLGPTARRVHVALGDDVTAVAEGALLGAYRYTKYKSAGESFEPSITVAVSDPRASREALRHARVVADAVTRTRDLVNTPPNDLYPASFAARAADLAEAAGLEVETLDARALKRGGYGGILGVGAGSGRPPHLVRLRYRPARPRARVALVGKGITFDSGGLNLKPGTGMAAMKSDMGGAAAVLTAVVALATAKVPVELIATVPMAENLPSGSAYRPSDVLTLRGGKTVEVTNTDAEGRLILADAIARAVEDEPDHLIEMSTLTGGQMVALGTRVIGAMGEPGFRDAVVAAGDRAGEAIWAMPLPDDLRPGLDSSVAELVNLPNDRWGSMLVGGLFLAEFVPDGLPWVHLDIAGPSFNEGEPTGYLPKGATGAGVRTIIATVEELAS